VTHEQQLQPTQSEPPEPQPRETAPRPRRPRGLDARSFNPSALVRARREERIARRRAAAILARPKLNLLAWARRYLPHYVRLEYSAMHRWLAEQMEEAVAERGLKLNVIGPRGGAKSTIATLAYVLQAAVERREPYIWIVSDTRPQACLHLDNVQAELLDNKFLAADYPQAAGRGRPWRQGAIRLKNGVSVEAYGTGQPLRGRRRREHRPTLIVCDDIQSDRHLESALLRDRSRRWFHGALLKAGTRRTNVVNLATALHREALALELHRAPGWRSRVFRAIERWPDNMPLWAEWEALYCDVDNARHGEVARAFYDAHREALHAGCELLWPEEEDLYTLMCLRAEGGRATFEREKQSAPAAPQACEWPEAYFEDDLWFDAWPARLRVRTLALDPSKGRDDRRGDYSAYVLLGVDERDVVYVEADLARRPTPRMVSDGVAHYRGFHPDAFGIEANQYQELLAPDFTEEFRRQGILAAEPFALDNRVNKRVRIRRLGPYLASRRLRFKANSPGTKLLVEQLQEFPTATHDDGPDALEMALRLAVEALEAAAFDDGLGDRLRPWR